MTRLVASCLLLIGVAMLCACVTEPEQPAQSAWEEAFVGDWVDGAQGGRSPDRHRD